MACYIIAHRKTVACCEKFAQHFAGKIARIHSDLDAVVKTSSVDVTVAPACLVLMDKFQFLQPHDARGLS